MAGSQIQTSGWTFTPPPPPASVRVPIQPDEAEALQRLCPSARLASSRPGVWVVEAEDLDDIADLRAFVQRRLDARLGASADGRRLRAVLYKLCDAEAG